MSAENEDPSITLCKIIVELTSAIMTTILQRHGQTDVRLAMSIPVPCSAYSIARVVSATERSEAIAIKRVKSSRTIQVSEAETDLT